MARCLAITEERLASVGWAVKTGSTCTAARLAAMAAAAVHSFSVKGWQDAGQQSFVDIFWKCAVKSPVAPSVKTVTPQSWNKHRLRRFAEILPCMLYEYALKPDGSSKFLFVGSKFAMGEPKEEMLRASVCWFTGCWVGAGSVRHCACLMVLPVRFLIR